MSAYQNFLDFFSMHNGERLDGLSESYFMAMTIDERASAFKFLMARVEQGGSEESVNGLFRADSQRAIAPIQHLLNAGILNEEAQIAAAWNLWKVTHDAELLAIFIYFMGSPKAYLREQAACCVPTSKFTSALKLALQEMIRTETEQLARIHAVDKIMGCYGISEDSVGHGNYLKIYRDLHSDDPELMEEAFTQLDSLYESPANTDHK